MKSMIRAAAVIVACSSAVVAVGCGIRPPREFHEPEKAVTVDLAPVPDVPLPADAGAEPDAAADEGPAGGTLSVALPWAVVPSLPLAQLLGKTRAEIDALKAPMKPETPEEKAAAKLGAKQGWTRYTKNLRVQFDPAGVAVALEQQVPSELSCVAAAKWLGFSEAESAVEGPERCTWTSDPGDNNLGGGASGELDRKTFLFTARRPAPAPAAE